MERMNKGAAAAMRPMTRVQLRAFYTTEYPKLIKILMFLDATIEEAEDAAQKAMADFVRRSRTMEAPDHPVTYVQLAAIRFFIKERQRTGSACHVNSEVAIWSSGLILMTNLRTGKMNNMSTRYSTT